jgi:hypothetical protein
MRLLILVFVATALTTLSRPAQAQFFPPYQARASTVGESYARGVSDMIQSAGVANLLNSEAAINIETARSKNLDNRLKGTETYFEMRRRNREYREAERGPRASSEQLFRLANEGLPDKLSVSELDPLTGKIAWPILLTRAEYNSDRGELEAAFGEWASSQGNLSSDAYLKIQQAANAMLGTLTSRVREYTAMSVPTSDYLAAKNFLRSLLHHSRQGA